MCTQAELMAFIFTNSSNPRVYSSSQISETEADLGLTRKRGSTEARQASLPINILKRDLFWNNPYPLGIHGVARRQLIDIDECGIYVESAKRTNGKSYFNIRVRDEGVYGHSIKYTLIAAVAASGWRYFTFRRVPGTNALDFCEFLAEVIDNQLPPAAQDMRTFMWDNLSSHKTAMVSNLVAASGHRRVARPPYRPADAPIEYVFNMLQQQLSVAMYDINNENDMVREVDRIMQSVCNVPDGFDALFQKIGYA